MCRKRSIQFFAALIFILSASTDVQAAPDGKALFQSNCAQCHNPWKDATGPALQGVSARVPSREWIYDWVHNSAKLIASGDKTANEVFEKWNKTPMTAFPNLSTEEIDAIIDWVETAPNPNSVAVGGGEGVAQAPEENNTWLY